MFYKPSNFDVIDARRTKAIFKIGQERARLPSATTDFVTLRVQSMKRSTTGLTVLFFNVTSAIGHGRTGKSTSSNFKGNRFAY